MTRFVHLRLHTEFSITDGIVRIDDAVARAVEDGWPDTAPRARACLGAFQIW